MNISEYEMSIYEQLLAKNMGVLKVQHTRHIDGKIHVLVKSDIAEYRKENLIDNGFIVHIES